MEGAAAEESRGQNEDLAQRYQHRVRFFARKVGRSFALSARWDDDLLSAGYWGLFKALDRRRPGAHERELSAYVSQRIRGAVIDEARLCVARERACEPYRDAPGAELRKGVEEAEAVRRGLSGACGADPEELASRERRREAIRCALGSLGPAERRLVLAYMEGASLAEIAEAEGLSPGTLQVRFQKASRLLRAKMPELRRILLDRGDA